MKEEDEKGIRDVTKHHRHLGNVVEVPMSQRSQVSPLPAFIQQPVYV